GAGRSGGRPGRPEARPGWRCGSGEGSLHPVADAPHGLDLVLADLAPEGADVDVDDVRAGIEVHAPDALEQLLPADRLALVAQQHLQQGVLAVGELLDAAVDLDASGTDVEPHAAVLEDARVLGGLVLAEAEPDARQ